GVRTAYRICILEPYSKNKSKVEKDKEGELEVKKREEKKESKRNQNEKNESGSKGDRAEKRKADLEKETKLEKSKIDNKIEEEPSWDNKLGDEDDSSETIVEKGKKGPIKTEDLDYAYKTWIKNVEEFRRMNTLSKKIKGSTKKEHAEIKEI
ncbi:4124_t:CDS:2, partial [Gigaspora rosea]